MSFQILAFSGGLRPLISKSEHKSEHSHSGATYKEGQGGHSALRRTESQNAFFAFLGPNGPKIMGNRDKKRFSTF